MTNCGQLMALLQRTPNPFVEKLTGARAAERGQPMGHPAQRGFSRDAVLAAYARIANRYGAILSGRDQPS